MGDSTKSGSGRGRAPRAEAGEKAEDQIRFYLNREFGPSKHLRIINNLRLLDEQNTKEDGEPDVCRIDHLVIHRWGMFIVESKSICEKITVRPDGTGGEQWTRTYKGREEGMNSPIAQAERQGMLLRRVLDRARQELLGKMPVGLRSISKLVCQSEYRGFGHMPIQVIVAVSSRGIIDTRNKWSPPDKPYQHFLCKADQVTAKIKRELLRHRKSMNPLAERDGEYGLWSIKLEEVDAVFNFLVERDSPRQPGAAKTEGTAVGARTPADAPRPKPPTRVMRTPTPSPTSSPSTNPTCKSCRGPQLSAMSGRYGYYWKCADCGINTAMPAVCSCCGAGGMGVRIRKEGPRYYRKCEKCGIEERIWTEPTATPSA